MKQHVTHTPVRIVGQALCLPSREASPLSSGERVRVRVSGIALIALLLATGCSTAGPRVIEVSSRTRLQDIGPAEARSYFGYDEASLFRYEPQDLSIENQREEFYVHWTPASISLVKFEYRQVAKPGTVFEKSYTPHGDVTKLFEVRGEEFRSGGSVSAWRVTLWKDDQLVAERKSVLW
jgi:hypothetical protein